MTTRIIGGDTETHPFGRANMAPLIVCVQHGLPDGSHAVAVTRDAEDTLAWMLGEHDQSWWHNGVGFDAAAILRSYPRIAHLVWDAFERGAFLDTMYLQRMIQIACGAIGGPLALDLVCQQWGIPPPTKVIEATVPAGHPSGRGGEIIDVRTSFDLWYGADAIPDPWFTYADYDGIVQPVLAARQVAKYCTPKTPGGACMVRLEDLAQVCRTYFGLNLARVYGLRVDTTNVATLANAAHNAIKRLREAAITNGFLKPAIATHVEVQCGYVAQKRVCPFRDELPPKKAAKLPAWQKRQAKHANCPGCKWQANDAAMTNRKRIKAHKDAMKLVEEAGEVAMIPSPELVPPTAGPDAAWKLDTAVLTAAITEAYDGKPPMTEPKKDKATGKMKGGGTIARSRDVLQDSGNEELLSWSTYNEWSAVVNKDLVMFETSPIHAGIGVTNNLRPSSFAPNVLNLRRDGFIVATCPNPACGYEAQLDKAEWVAIKKAGRAAALPCPACEDS
jgi:hypothetical protein